MRKQIPFQQKATQSGSESPEKRAETKKPGFRGLGGACAPGDTLFPHLCIPSAGVKRGHHSLCPIPTQQLQAARLISESLYPCCRQSPQAPGSPGPPGHRQGSMGQEVPPPLPCGACPHIPRPHRAPLSSTCLAGSSMRAKVSPVSFGAAPPVPRTWARSRHAMAI